MRALLAMLLVSLLPAYAAEPCRTIRGRATFFSGDGVLQIWHVGTHHTFFPADKPSFDRVCEYLHCSDLSQQPALSADFDICPTEPYRAGAAQAAEVRRVRHPRLRPEAFPDSSATPGLPAAAPTKPMP